jgi:hypothetical protein
VVRVVRKDRPLFRWRRAFTGAAARFRRTRAIPTGACFSAVSRVRENGGASAVTDGVDDLISNSPVRDELCEHGQL